MASAGEKRKGLIYAWDPGNSRVVALDKAKGTFVEQYRLAGGNPAWADIRGMYVTQPAADGAPATLVWATRDAVMSAVLEAIPDTVSPSGSGGPSPSASPAPSGRASAKPSRAP
jgi:hypothetical protein